ncbi:MAG: sugar ABC transporter permease [Anaerolineae bacterium]|nr:sugar ABC transporter permease [Anaerolineae bacterium]
MAVTAAERVRKRQMNALGKGLLFALPWLLGFLAFTAYPMAASLYYSLTRYDVLRPPRFIGLENYSFMLFSDNLFRLVLSNTVWFVAVGVPAGLVIAFLLANLLNNDLKLRPLFRTLFYLPAILPAVASAEVWRWVYNPRYGLINSLLKAWGLATIPWLSSPALAKPSLVIIHCWAQGTAIVIFLAALQDVPRTLYDAAVVDGANAWNRFWHVTVPMCTPSILFVSITGLIGMFQYFTLGWLLTQGAPNNATEFYSMYLYRNAFLYFKMGYASALAWGLFVVIVTFTVVMMRSSARWVYYGGEAV